MMKWATLVSVVLIAFTGDALAGGNTSSNGTVTVASSSGIYVRTSYDKARAGSSRGNVYSSAINTGGVVRATKAVRVNGRVVLRGGTRTNNKAVRIASTGPARRVKSTSRKSRPRGLGALLASIFRRS